MRDDQGSRAGVRESGACPTADLTRGGDRVRGLVDAHYDFIWRSLRRVGVPEADTDDAAQEVFLIASRRLADLEPGRERAFLFGTALRVASDQRRRAFRRYEQLDGAAVERVDGGPDPEALLGRARARQRLDEVLETLSLEQRAVFVLFELEQMTAPEIAALLGIPLGTVASRLRRARELFATVLQRRRAADEVHGGRHD